MLNCSRETRLFVIMTLDITLMMRLVIKRIIFFMRPVPCLMMI